MDLSSLNQTAKELQDLMEVASFYERKMMLMDERLNRTSNDFGRVSALIEKYNES